MAYATRKTQPFKKGQATRQGAGLRAAVRGRTAGGINPMDSKRAAQKRVAQPNRAKKVGSLRGAARKRAGARPAPATPKRARSTVVRARKSDRPALKDGLAPRIYAKGTKTNTSGPRKNERYSTFTKGGVEFHEYRRKGKTVVVSAGRKPKTRRVGI